MFDVFSALFKTAGGPVLVGLGLIVLYNVFLLTGINAGPVIAILVATSPLWLPVILFFLAVEFWLFYSRRAFMIANGRVSLRIMLPQEVFKSPAAMESVIAQIHNPNSADNPWQGWIDGKHPLIYSFELVSIGGEVRFYVNVPRRKTKNAIEAQLYAQYPGIEIIEEPIEYTAEIPWDPDRYEYMGFRMGKKEAQEFPIKTYIDFGLDKMPKEEEKVEPMAPLLEQLAAIQPHERLWVQILARPHVKKTFKAGNLRESGTWESKVHAKIDDLLGRVKGSKLGPAEFESQPRLTTGERDMIAAMERNAGKYPYETTIRWLYITEKGKFNGDLISPMLRAFSEFDIIGRNGVAIKWRTDFDYNIFQDPRGTKKMAYKKRELQDYKLRQYVYRTAEDQPKIMTCEEIATLFHIPGRSVITPSLNRIPSTRSEAPANLPVG